jgi:hypothetical protein
VRVRCAVFWLRHYREYDPEERGGKSQRSTNRPAPLFALCVLPLRPKHNNTTTTAWTAGSRHLTWACLALSNPTATFCLLGPRRGAQCLHLWAPPHAVPPATHKKRNRGKSTGTGQSRGTCPAAAEGWHAGASRLQCREGWFSGTPDLTLPWSRYKMPKKLKGRTDRPRCIILWAQTPLSPAISMTILPSPPALPLFWMFEYLLDNRVSAIPFSAIPFNDNQP